MKIIPNIDKKLAEAAEQIRGRYAKMMDDVAKPYTKTEQLTWDTQVKEADAYLADNKADVPMISVIATNRAVPLSDLVARIKENEARYMVAVGTLLGQQQAELDALYAEKP